MRRHPDAVVRVEFTLSESPEPQVREMSVRELAENHLEGADGEPLESEAPCYERGRSRLGRLLEETR